MIVTSTSGGSIKNMFPRSLIIAIILLAAIAVSAQNATEINKNAEAKAAEEKAAEEFRAERSIFLRDTLANIQNLRTRENRISFSAEVAALMWDEDEKQARSLFANAAGEMIEIIRQIDQQMMVIGAGEEQTSYGLFAEPTSKSRLTRKFSTAMGVRQQIAQSIVALDPDLAFSFFYDSRNVIADPALRKVAEQQDTYFEGQLLASLAAADIKKAAAIGARSVKDGLNYSHLDILRKIYEKDADKGAEFGAAILSSIKDKKPEIYLLTQLLSYGGENADQAKKSNKRPIYSDSDLRDIAEVVAKSVLDGREIDEMTADNVAESIEKYLPSRAVQIRAKYPSGNGGGRKEVYTVRGSAPPPRAISTSGQGTGTGSAINVGDDESEETKAMKDMMKLQDKELPVEERNKIVANARRIIAETKGSDKKIIALSMLAAQVAKLGDQQLADQIMRDAEGFVNPQPKNAKDFLYSWMLVSGYAHSNPAKAFDILDNLVYRANDLLGAAVKIGEFVDVNEDIFNDGEVQIGSFGGSMIRGMTSGLGAASGLGMDPLRSLAKADMKRLAGITNRFERPEARVLAKMLVLRAIYNEKKKNVEIEDADMK